LRDYEPVWREMRAFTDARGSHGADEFWLVEHPPVFTLGQAGRDEHVLAPGEIPLVRSDRGGQVTYHGPGQIVLYTLVNMRRLGIGVRTLVASLEDAVIAVLNTQGITGLSRAGAPGVYVGDAKVAALGLRVRNACTYHGVALNVEMDLEPFSRINPCGYEGLQVTSLRELGSSLSLDAAGLALAQGLAQELGVALADSSESTR
jgi:lipoyl(octanoyl) transferase